MVKDRLESIDFIRAVAIVIIVTCHFLLYGGISGFSPIGRYLAGIGNMLFFGISAFLFGFRYLEKGNAAFSAKEFLPRRMMRLFSSLWPFLTIVLIAYLLTGEHLSPIKIFLNYMGLGWFGKIVGIPHLWFVTMMIIIYLSYTAVGEIGRHKVLYQKFQGGGILTVFCLLLEYVFDLIPLPGAVFTILWISLLIFFNAQKVWDWICKLRFVLILLTFIAFNILSILTCFFESLVGIAVRDWASYLAAFSLLMMLLRIGNKITVRKGILLLSSYSYELYLVHHVFCCDRFKIINIFVNPLIDYVILWIVSIVCAVGLKYISDKFYGLLNASFTNVKN